MNVKIAQKGGYGDFLRAYYEAESVYPGAKKFGILSGKRPNDKGFAESMFYLFDNLSFEGVEGAIPYRSIGGIPSIVPEIDSSFMKYMFTPVPENYVLLNFGNSSRNPNMEHSNVKNWTTGRQYSKMEAAKIALEFHDKGYQVVDISDRMDLSILEVVHLMYNSQCNILVDSLFSILACAMHESVRNVTNVFYKIKESDDNIVSSTTCGLYKQQGMNVYYEAFANNFDIDKVRTK